MAGMTGMTKFDPKLRASFGEFADDFDAVEAAHRQWRDRFDAARAGVEHGLERATRQRQNNVELLVSVNSVGLASRISQLTEAVIGLVDADNPHAAPPVARALFEMCCVPIYLRRELIPRVTKGRVDAAQKLVFRVGLGGTGALPGHIKPVAVDALIKAARGELRAMEASLPEQERIQAEQLIDLFYGPLTDLTHPNWAALTLGTDLSNPFDPQFSRSASFDDALIHDVVSSSAYILDRGGKAFDEVLTTLREFGMDLPNEEPRWSEGEVRQSQEGSKEDG